MKKQTCIMDVNIPYDLTVDGRKDHYVRCRSTFIYDMITGGLKMDFWIYDESGLSESQVLKPGKEAANFLLLCKKKIELATEGAAKLYFVQNSKAVIQEFNEVQEAIECKELSSFSYDDLINGPLK